MFLSLHRPTRSFENRQSLCGNQQADRPCDTRLPFNEPSLVQVQDHLMDTRWRDTEEPLHISFCRSSTIDLIVVVYKGKILPLLFRKLFQLVILFLKHNAELSGTPTWGGGKLACRCPNQGAAVRHEVTDFRSNDWLSRRSRDGQS